MADMTRGEHTTIVLTQWESHLLGSFLSHHTPLGVKLGGYSDAMLEAIKLSGTSESEDQMVDLVDELIQRLYG